MSPILTNKVTRNIPGTKYNNSNPKEFQKDINKILIESNCILDSIYNNNDITFLCITNIYGEYVYVLVDNNMIIDNKIYNKDCIITKNPINNCTTINSNYMDIVTPFGMGYANSVPGNIEIILDSNSYIIDSNNIKYTAGYPVTKLSIIMSKTTDLNINTRNISAKIRTLEYDNNIDNLEESFKLSKDINESINKIGKQYESNIKDLFKKLNKQSKNNDSIAMKLLNDQIINTNTNIDMKNIIKSLEDIKSQLNRMLSV